MGQKAKTLRQRWVLWGAGEVIGGCLKNQGVRWQQLLLTPLFFFSLSTENHGAHKHTHAFNLPTTRGKCSCRIILFSSY